MAKLKKIKNKDENLNVDESSEEVLAKDDKDKKEVKKDFAEDKKEKIEQMLTVMNKDSKGLIFSCDKRAIEENFYFSTDSFWLDYAVGFGIPKGRFVMVWGTESSMKSTLTHKIAADAQKRDRKTGKYIDLKKIGATHYYDSDSRCWINSSNPKDVIECNVVAIVDIEGTLDVEWAKKNGLDYDAILYSAPEYGEQAVDLVENLIASHLADVIIVDSIAILSTDKEMSVSTEKSQMGTDRATLMNRACRKWTSRMNEIKTDRHQKPLVLLVNQLRQKVGIVFGSSDTRPGGNGQNFLTSIEIKTKSGQVTYLDEEKRYPLWVEMHGIINKNKCAPPKIEYSFFVAVNDYDPAGHQKPVYPIPFKQGDILEHKSVIEYATKLNLVGKDGNQYFIRLGDEEHLYNKKTDLLNEWFYFDKVNYKRVKEHILARLTGKTLG